MSKLYETVFQNCAQLNPSDFLCLKLPDQPPPIPPVQRTVFQHSTDWASPSSEAVLDALSSTYLNQPSNTKQNPQLLNNLQITDSPALDSHHADIFDTGVFTTAFETKSNPFSKRINTSRIVKCNHCDRPLLITRVLEHYKMCPNRPIEEKGNQDNVQLPNQFTMLNDDISLIETPYGRDKQSYTKPKNEANLSKIEKTNSAEATVEDGYISEKSDHSTETNFFDYREEDDWETELVPLWSEKKRSYATAKRHRLFCPPPVETTAQRKRNNSIEKKAAAAALSAGFFPNALNKSSSASAQASAKNDPLYRAAEKMGSNVPWSKLMQMSMPIFNPRNNKRKAQAMGDTIEIVNNRPRVKLGQPPTLATAKRSRYGEGSDKTGQASDNVMPTLAGALCWLRGEGVKELATSTLHLMESPPVPLPRSNAIFRGQTHFTHIGAFSTDPIAPSAIRFPNVAPNLFQNRSSFSSGSAGYVASQGSDQSHITKQQQVQLQQPQPNVPPVPSQPITTKRQKQGRNPRANANSKANQSILPTIQGKPAMQNVRKNIPTGVSAGINPSRALPMHSQVQQKQNQFSRNNMPHLSVTQQMNAMGTSPLAAAVVRYPNPQQMQQKNPIRTSPNTGAVPLVAPPQNAPMLGVNAMNMKGPGRGGKARSHQAANAAAVTAGMRVKNGRVSKNQSPSQSSARSGDRNSMLSIPNSTQFDHLQMTKTKAEASSRSEPPVNTTERHNSELQQLLDQLNPKVATPAKDEMLPTLTRANLHNKRGHQSPEALIEQLKQKQHAMQSQASTAIQGFPLHNPGVQKQIGRQPSRPPSRNSEIPFQELERQVLRNNLTRPETQGQKSEKRPSASHFLKQNERNMLDFNPNPQNVYAAGIPGAAPNIGMNIPQTNPLHMSMLGLAHTNPGVMGGRSAGKTPTMMPGRHDFRSVQGLQVPVIQNAAQKKNLMNLYETNGLNLNRPLHSGMSVGLGNGITGPMMRPGISTSMSQNLLVQELLSSQAVNHQNHQNPLQAQQALHISQQLGNPHAHPGSRSNSVHSGVQQRSQPSPNEKLNTIDRVFSLEIDDPPETDN